MARPGVADPPGVNPLIGLVLGTAVGDSFCLPYEGMPAARAHRRLHRLGLRHSLLMGRGMLSDDTEHTAMVVLAYLASGGEPDGFERALAGGLRRWFVCLPPGVGLGTARACIKLCLGVRSPRSGVRSAGNGPAMRSGALGLLAEGERLRTLVERSARITHTDDRAVEGAWIIAACAGIAARVAPGSADGAVASTVLPELHSEELRRGVELALECAGGAPIERLLSELGCERGVTGFVCHTVPAAVAVWLLYAEDFRGAMEAVIRMGGDTDTVGAIVGGLVGARVGAGGIPGEWLDGVADWPISVRWLRELAQATAEGGPVPGRFWPATPVRNLFLLGVVLAHGFRRLIPESG